MITIKAIHIAPVKSLGLVNPRTVDVTPSGILEDRRLHLINHRGRLLTQREVGQLVQLKVEYQTEPESLCLRFPDGASLADPLDFGEPVITQIWGRYVPGHVVTGDWNSVLSHFCGEPVRLVRADQPGQCYDEYPVSLVSEATVQRLSQQARVSEVSFDSRRFRPTFFLDGCHPYEEDTWLGGAIQIGDQLLLRVVARDPRCDITTHDPETGRRDIDTLRLIRSYRPSSRAAYLGVYGIIERPGTASLGDRVRTTSL